MPILVAAPLEASRGFSPALGVRDAWGDTALDHHGGGSLRDHAAAPTRIL